mgnify:CR=1 FL=1
MQRIALLDVLINNADRKAGHVLIEETEETAEPARLWGIDHGICFHVDAKLRTVIWEFGGPPIPPALKAGLDGGGPQPDTPADHRLTSSIDPTKRTALETRVFGKRVPITDHTARPPPGCAGVAHMR